MSTTDSPVAREAVAAGAPDDFRPLDVQPDPDDVERFIGELGEVMSGASTLLMAALGDRLGLYRSLAEHGAATAAELAERTGCGARYLQEWLAQQASAGVLTHEGASGRFTLPPAHAFVLAVEDSPAAFGGGIESLASLFADLGTLERAVTEGEGVPWGHHDGHLYPGAARFFGTAYRSLLVADWVPALGIDGVLHRGARVADIGCGEGTSTLLLARAYEDSRFVGIDGHRPSVEAAGRRAAEWGLGDRVRFTTGDAMTFDGGPYDVVWFFNVLHDLGDPVAVAAHAREQLVPGGTLALVEPFALDDPVANIADNPEAPMAYAMSTFLCVPHSLSEPGRRALGAQCGGRVMFDVLREAGFTDVDRVATTPDFAVYAAR